MDEPSALPPRRKGIYLLPNLFTTVTLFGGFYAVVMAMSGRFDNAALGILAAMIADALDGRIARMTNTATDFGKEYDSLCDMVAFGVAASLVMFSFSLEYLSEYRWLGGRLGWVVAFTYTACAALRLARFNVLTNIAGGSKDFFGLPSPAAAGLVTFFVWAAHNAGYAGQDVLWLAAPLTLAAGLLMVSSVRYNSFKKLDLGGRLRFVPFAAVVGVLVLVMIDPPRILFLVFLVYALSGPVMALARRFQRPATSPEE
ncbi:CDP-diacylglycerol--serine O-phosphatidyltransferase [Panacagrimonas sp.]|uniref:CDP-diacylglycerol--serine O-phosphatidyltransferase n=1 Tax=Panacagrimonas sp. TaxID=2480088 RepID=UPI003B52BBE2